MPAAKNLPYESLHNHTVISDGQSSHLEVLGEAEQSGFGLISFTDHDILPRSKDLKALQTYDGPVEWNIGIEISSGLPHELGGGPATLFHILGLRIDPTNPKLQEYCEDAEEARLDRLERTVANLQKAGFLIDLDTCLSFVGEGAPGTPHITHALFTDTSNVARLETIAAEMGKRSTNDPQLARKYEQMMLKANSGQRHPYVRELLFSDQAYVPDVYVPYGFSLEMDRSVELIRAAGGLAVIAHWPAVRDSIDEELLTKIAYEQRIDGLELRTVFNANPSLENDIAFLKDLVHRYNLVPTVGVDGHEPDDFQKFIALPGAADMSVDQWENIVNY